MRHGAASGEGGAWMSLFGTTLIVILETLGYRQRSSGRGMLVGLLEVIARTGRGAET